VVVGFLVAAEEGGDTGERGGAARERGGRRRRSLPLPTPRNRRRRAAAQQPRAPRRAARCASSLRARARGWGRRATRAHPPPRGGTRTRLRGAQVWRRQWEGESRGRRGREEGRGGLSRAKKETAGSPSLPTRFPPSLPPARARARARAAPLSEPRAVVGLGRRGAVVGQGGVGARVTKRETPKNGRASSLSGLLFPPSLSLSRACAQAPPPPLLPRAPPAFLRCSERARPDPTRVRAGPDPRRTTHRRSR
jgi:hypothetical protein